MDDELDAAINRISKAKPDELDDQIEKEITRFWNAKVASAPEAEKGFLRRVRTRIVRTVKSYK